MLPITKPLPSSTRSILAGIKAYEHFRVETKQVMALLPEQFKAIVSCMPALPQTIILGFDAEGNLVGHAHLGGPETVATPIPAAPPKAKVVLPELPMLGEIDGKKYSLE